MGKRQIIDASFIANKVVDDRMRSRVSGLLCKLDIEKAYDHVNWNQIYLRRDRMGFWERWRKWISFMSLRYAFRC